MYIQALTITTSQIQNNFHLMYIQISAISNTQIHRNFHLCIFKLLQLPQIKNKVISLNVYLSSYNYHNSNAQ